MKLAIICPMGDLNRFGYWRVAPICLEGWRNLGDLFLIHSSRATVPFVTEAVYLRDECTLMQLRDGAEWFDYQLVAANANRGLQAAREAGYDCAITVCCNWHVENEQARAIQEKCRSIVRDDLNCGFLYRRLQIGAQLFDADRMSIAIINLRKTPAAIVKVLVDRIEIGQSDLTSTRGDYSDRHAEAYIDCEYELTVDELRDKLSDIRNYEDILPKRRGVDWEYWLKYYRQRARALNASSDELGCIGQQILAAHPAGSFADWMLEQVVETPWLTS